MGPITNSVRTNPQWMEELANNYFSTHRSTTFMTRVSVSEDAVISALLRLPAAIHIAPVGVISRRKERYDTANLNAIAAMDVSDVPDSPAWRIDKKITKEGNILTRLYFYCFHC